MHFKLEYQRATTHLNVCRTALLRRSMIFTRSSREQLSSSVRSWLRSKDVTRPSSSSSCTILSDLITRNISDGDRSIWAQQPNSNPDSPDVPETNFLIEVSAHHTLLRADDVITARTSEHRLHAWEKESLIRYFKTVKSNQLFSPTKCVQILP